MNVYRKIGIVTGFIWIVLFLSTNNTCHSYPYMFINVVSILGVIISIVFILVPD